MPPITMSPGFSDSSGIMPPHIVRRALLNVYGIIYGCKMPQPFSLSMMVVMIRAVTSKKLKMK